MSSRRGFLVAWVAAFVLGIVTTGAVALADDGGTPSDGGTPTGIQPTTTPNYGCSTTDWTGVGASTAALVAAWSLRRRSIGSAR